MLLFHFVPPVFLWLTVVIFGLALGSFTTCIVYRLPRKIPVVKLQGRESRSFCPQCQHPLAAIDLVPVFSWLWQKGRCRYCGNPIGRRYVLIELAVLLCVVGIASIYGFSIKTFGLSLLIPAIAGFIAVFASKRPF